ncbi:ARM repeat superfamily protein [Euphorbia peplus]|nr:ARM repeat superfamily protein [Euphorbia peplus]WCJ43825.1 ARM repeat superfamily protein [Euphorbia peplus]
MGSSAVLFVAAVMMMLSTTVVAVAEFNKTTSSSSLGLGFGSTDDSDTTDDDSSVVNDHLDLDGGFSSLDGMLHWAIGHSDPAKLKETEDYVSFRLGEASIGN